jgi:hypothetical protein
MWCSRRVLVAVLSGWVTAGLMVPSAAADTSYGELIGDRSVVFAEDARLFETPSESSAVVCSPPVGTEVFRLAAVDILHTADSLSSPWMEGVCELDGETFRGYIPMSWLALTYQELGADTLLVFGIDSRGALYGNFVGVAKVVSGGRMLWGVAFYPPNTDFGESGSGYGYGVSSQRLDPAGFSGIEDLVMLSFLYEACGYENREVLLAWTGRYLIAGISASRVAEAGIFHYTEEILLPGTDPSLVNLVSIVSTSEEYDDAAGEYFTVDTDTTIWMWNGIDYTRISD